jgi:ATP adenylyltransferase/5',5'''-P-1,P-4-tetraphosphate phosphorylase II
MQQRISPQIVPHVIPKQPGHHQLLITIPSTFRYTQENIRGSGIHVLSAIQFRPIIQFSHVQIVMNTIKRKWTANTGDKADMSITAQIVLRATQEEVANDIKSKKNINTVSFPLFSFGNSAD